MPTNSKRYLNDKGEIGILYSDCGSFVTTSRSNDGDYEDGLDYHSSQKLLDMAMDADLVKIVVEDCRGDLDEKAETSEAQYIKNVMANLPKWNKLIAKRYPEFLDKRAIVSKKFSFEDLAYMRVAFVKPGQKFAFINRSDFDNHGYGEALVLGCFELTID